MPSFIYKAKKGTSETVTGQLVAQDQDEAVELIAQLGLLPISVEEKSVEQRAQSLLKRQKIRAKDLYVFSRQLGTMLKSGIPLLKALDMIIRQMPHPYLKEVLTNIRLDVRDGRSFSTSLEDYPDVFSSLYVSMARAGEESGNLREMLNNVSLYQKAQDELASKVRSALVYPLVMAGVGALTVIFILTYVMPKLSGLFNSLGSDLPWPTQIVLQLSYISQYSWPVMLAVVVGVGFFIKYGKRSRRIKAFLLRFLFQTPFVGAFLLKAELERFFRTLHLLLRSGISILKALEVTIPVIRDIRLKRQLFEATEDLRQGKTLGVSLNESKLIPEMAIQLIAVGEESGSLVGSLEDLADSYRQDVEESMKITTTLIEPIMILLVGLVVGFIVFAMLLPIFYMDVLAQ